MHLPERERVCLYKVTHSGFCIDTLRYITLFYIDTLLFIYMNPSSPFRFSQSISSSVYSGRLPHVMRINVGEISENGGM